MFASERKLAAPWQVAAAVRRYGDQIEIPQAYMGSPLRSSSTPLLAPWRLGGQFMCFSVCVVICWAGVHLEFPWRLGGSS
jgi:hypothetical protein